MEIIGAHRTEHDDAGQPADILGRGQRGELLPELGLVAGLAIGQTELELIDPVVGLDEPIRARRFGVEEELVEVGVETTHVGPQPGGEQQTVVEREEFLLGICTQVVDLGPELHHLDIGSGVDVRLPADQVPADDPADILGPPGKLDPDRSGGGVLAVATRKGMDDIAVQVQIEVVGIAQECRARLPIVALELELRWEEQIVHLIEEVDTAIHDEPHGAPRRSDRCPVNFR